MTSDSKLKNIVEVALMAAGKPLSLDQMISLFLDQEQPDRNQLRTCLKQLQVEYQARGIELAEVAGGYRFQVRNDYSTWVSRLWEERPARYSRALLETLALIAYRQPITRGEIEEIRGVSVSSSIMKTLMERDWVRVVGQRDVPGRPSLYATTREFLAYFNLNSLNDLPTLQEIRDLDSINRELQLEEEGGVSLPLAGRGPDGEAPAVNMTDTAGDEIDSPEDDAQTTLEDSSDGDSGEKETVH